jgi:predicted lipoprotein
MMKYSKTRSLALSFNRKLIAVALASVFVISACGEDATSTSGDGFNNEKNTNTDFDQGQLIASIVDNVITPTYQEFSSLAAVQQQAVSDYCQQEIALGQNNSSEVLVNDAKLLAKESWRNAMNTWQQAEMMQLAPLTIGDGALRNNIYSWPIQNSCGVDLDVTYFKAGSVNGKPYDISKRTASRKSLLALEYLLFNDNLDHSCTGSTIPENWNNQTQQYRRIARCEYASEVAKDIKFSSETLLTAWLGNNADIVGYANELKAAGSDGSEFETEHHAVNKLSDALFYMDIFTKSAKLAEPVGIELNKCGSQPCPEVVEALYSHHSLENIINNIQAFKLFIQGGGDNGIGFRDYLIDVGDKATADSLDANIEQVLISTEAYQSTLAETLVTNPEQVVQTHTEVKNITDKLKSDFITSLALELPKTAAGDND